MDADLKLIAENWTNLIKQIKTNFNITDIAFKTWIIQLEPLEIINDVLYIKCSKEDNVLILNEKYKPLFQAQIEESFNLSLDVVFIYQNNEYEKNNDALFLKNNLNPKFTFDTFIKGDNNALAYAAALNVSEKPAGSYNPLFIYGGPGLGKTHMMNAIAHRILKNNPKKKVLYVTSEQFTNELIDSIRNTSKSNSAFRNKYRNIDVLLIDDIQFIIGKESTQEEFFHTFNTLHAASKQIVISSDKPPKDLETLEERLKSRFQSGFIVDIQIPNFETRMAILKMYEDLESIYFPNNILEYIVSNIKTNVRTLEGAFKTLVASTRLIYPNYREYSSEMPLEEAKRLIKDYVTPISDIEITPELIFDTVAQHYKVSISDILGKSKKKDITLIRHITMYLCHQLLDNSLKEIGDLMNGRDHSTIINGRDRVVADMAKSSSFKDEIAAIIKKIKY